MPWFVYIVRCNDRSLYTGITTDVARRMDEHNGLSSQDVGAKYTKARRPVELVYTKECPDKSTAAREEYRIRTLPKSTKEALVG